MTKAKQTIGQTIQEVKKMIPSKIDKIL